MCICTLFTSIAIDKEESRSEMGHGGRGRGKKHKGKVEGDKYCCEMTNFHFLVGFPLLLTDISFWYKRFMPNNPHYNIVFWILTCFWRSWFLSQLGSHLGIIRYKLAENKMLRWKLMITEDTSNNLVSRNSHLKWSLMKWTPLAALFSTT